MCKPAGVYNPFIFIVRYEVKSQLVVRWVEDHRGQEAGEREGRKGGDDDNDNVVIGTYYIIFWVRSLREFN